MVQKKKESSPEEEKSEKAGLGKNHKEKELKTLTKRVSDLETQIREGEDKYLRLVAEFDNYRKRTLKEKMELSKLAGEEFFRSLLPVIDDFERGLEVIDKSSDLKALKDGINLIYNKFKEFLSQNGVREIEALNLEFDTELHEAVTKINVSDASMKGKVVDVVSRGYTLHDKVIRFPKVVVGDSLEN
jgi:molecular chaperone GrpE